MDTEPHPNYKNQSNHQNRSPPLHYFNFLNFSYCLPLTEYKGYSIQNQVTTENKPSSKQNQLPQSFHHKEQQQVSLLKDKEKMQKQVSKNQQTLKQRQKQKYSFQSLDKKEKVEQFKQIHTPFKQIQEQRLGFQSLDNKEKVEEQKQNQQHKLSVSVDTVRLLEPVEKEKEKYQQIVVNSNSQADADTLRGKIHEIGKWLLQFVEDWKGLKSDIKNSQIYLSCKNKKQEISNQLGQPIKRLYRNFPSIMTQAKYQLISQYSYKERILFLTTLSILSGVGSLHLHRQPGVKILRMANRLIVGFMIGSFFITPEIYYNLMQENISSLDKSDSKIQIKKQ